MKQRYETLDLNETTMHTNTSRFPLLDETIFKSMICNRSIEGANKNITMNHICDRVDIGYSVYDLDPDTGELEVNLFQKKYSSNCSCNQILFD